MQDHSFDNSSVNKEQIKSPLVVALDYPCLEQAIAMADKLDPTLCRVKVGKELFTRVGPSILEALHRRGFQVFLDLKFHDIPNTTANAVAVAADLGVWMVNVHASGGRQMMEACANKLAHYSSRPLLIGVTVLTSMTQTDLSEVGIAASPLDHVLSLSGLAKSSGLDGVVCSAQEARALKQIHGSSFFLVTPGIRPDFASKGDQQRIMTPAEALAAGSDYLVVGRPITQADDPSFAMNRVLAEIGVTNN
jgi:orotidine-5'-phosphate decarboxylase